MNANNFEYDGRYASDFGLIICTIDSPEMITSLGSELNLNQVPIRNGAEFLVSNPTYDTPLETTFQVIKYDCKRGYEELSINEHREIVRWLNRKTPRTLRLIGEDSSYDYVHFEGSFSSISKIEINGRIYGYELHFVSNHPYALGDTVNLLIKATRNNYVYEFEDVSDEIGYIYPKMKITCTQDCDLSIYNSIENRTTTIANCLQGEVIQFDEYLNISTSLPSHKIQNDFNYVFFRIANTYEDRINSIKISHPCTIEIEYTPIVKGVGF